VYGTAGGGEGLAGGGATGVHGTGTENGVLATGGTFGVFSEGTDYGVYAASSGGYGVFSANTSSTGVGVYASGAGMALQVNGKTEFSRSGRATIAGTSGSPKSSVTVTNVALTAKSLVLATPQRYQAGVYIEAAVPNVSGSSITIYLSKAVTKNFPVAWMVTEKP
jgi:hypothetical protein